MILDCKKIKDAKVSYLKNKFENIKENIILTIIEIGDNEASKIYIKNKIKLCEYLGIEVHHIKFNDETKEDIIIDCINKENENEFVYGIIVELPISNKYNINRILNTISPDKDVDGLTNINIGKLVNNEECFIPCTVLSILDILNYYNIDIESKNICIIGRSILVGKPLTIALCNKNATVTLCHSKTKNLKDITKDKDILIVAINKAKYITKEYVKKDSVIIDVGINRLDNKICGDVNTQELCDYVKIITPVPNGVGLITTCELMNNIYKSYLLRNKNV